MFRISRFAVAASCLALLFGTSPTVQSAEKVVTAGAALDLMFHPPRVPNVPTKGALQRTSFQALLQGTERELQIAFVIDGTESMSKDIESVLNTLPAMAGDLQKQKGSKNVSYNVIVYRDVEAPSGPVVAPLGLDFTSDVGKLRAAVGQIRPETGAPYFPELIDLGISTAIQKLNWKNAKESSRWVIVFGDAPPYDEGFDDPAAKVKRMVSTKELIRQAKAAEITVSCILCSSGFAGNKPDAQELVKTFNTAAPSLRTFMNSLAQETKGVVWDLSNDAVREALVEAGKAKRFPTQEIALITPDHLQEQIAKANSRGDNNAPSNRVRLAILPHLPLDAMTFDEEHAAVNVAAEMRERFRQVPRIEVVNPGKLIEAFEQAADAGLTGENELLQRIAIDTKSDYVVWGSLVSEGEMLKLTTGIYDKVDGSQLAEAGRKIKKSDLGEASIVFTVAEKLAMKTAQQLKDVDAGIAKTFSQVRSNESVSKSFNTPVASSPRAAREIWTGLEALEQSLAFAKGDPEGKKKLETAILKLNAAKAMDRTNPFVYSLLASAYFNLAEVDVAEDTVQLYLKAIQRAYDYRDRAFHESLRTEIEADYALLIEQDIPQAVKLYQQLATAESGKIQSARRAHWMLAGIYCGDWGVPNSFVDANKARDHILTIMAVFQGSPEDAAYRKAMDWDAKQGTQHPHVQKSHGDLAKK